MMHLAKPRLFLLGVIALVSISTFADASLRSERYSSKHHSRHNRHRSSSSEEHDKRHSSHAASHRPHGFHDIEFDDEPRRFIGPHGRIFVQGRAGKKKKADADADDGSAPAGTGVGEMAANMIANFASNAWNKGSKMVSNILANPTAQDAIAFAQNTASSLGTHALNAVNKYGGMAIDKGTELAGDLLETAKKYGPTVLSEGATAAKILAEKALRTGMDVANTYGGAVLEKGMDMASNVLGKVGDSVKYLGSKAVEGGMKLGLNAASTAMSLAEGSDEERKKRELEISAIPAVPVPAIPIKPTNLIK